MRRSIDKDLFRGRDAAIGQFRCPVDHPLFRETGPITECVVVFPRTSVWIAHDGQRPFVADPTVVTIYNRAQRYTRSPISRDGDRCDWFAVSDDVAREIAALFDPSAADAERPFRVARAPASSPLYMRQRMAVTRAQRGELDAFEGEELAMEIVGAALERARREQSAPAPGRQRADRRRRELVAAASAHIAATFTRNQRVRAIAEAVGASPYHLCREFRKYTGHSMREYRNELRARRALDYWVGSPQQQSRYRQWPTPLVLPAIRTWLHQCGVTSARLRR